MNSIVSTEGVARPAQGSATLRFLTFRVGDRAYALPAEDVAQVMRVPAVARVPQSPVALLGIANLRGSVIPVASLRGLLKMETRPADSDTRAVVLDAGSPLAIVVDFVDSLVTIDAAKLETRQSEFGAVPGENLSGAFAAGNDGAITKVIDIATLLEATFAKRTQATRVSRPTPIVREAEKTAGNAGDAPFLVTFEVAGQEFALGLDAVQEILPAPNRFTMVPRADDAVLGMTSHRDSLLPLLSMRRLLGFAAAPEGELREKVLVVKFGNVRVGLVADRARAILTAVPSLMDSLPAVVASRTGGEARIRAIYRGEEGRRLVSVLAPEHLFREDVMQRLIAENDTGATPVALSGQTLQRELQFLVFRLGDDEFGLPIEFVDEVATVPEKITRVPKAPKFLDGVVNLRGSILPVVDQRRRFAMAPHEKLQTRRLVVVRSERHRAGLIVDSVSEVLRTTADAVEAAPNLTDDIARLVRGVINLASVGRIVLLLDPTELLTQAERGLLDAFHSKTAQANA